MVASRGDYAEACRLKQEFAFICHSQGKIDDAYLLEHAGYVLLEKAGRTSDWENSPASGSRGVLAANRPEVRNHSFGRLKGGGRDDMRLTPDNPKIPAGHSENFENDWKNNPENIPENIPKRNDENVLTEAKRQKIFQAFWNMIVETNGMSYHVKYIFMNLACHEPLEDFVYDTVFLYEEGGKPRTPRDFYERSARLYYLHSRLNETLDRAHKLRDNVRDDFLLNCILSEGRKRQVEIPSIPDKDLKTQIYRTFQKYDWNKKDIPRNPDDRYDNFDEYLSFLFTKERNGLNDFTFNSLWNKALGLRRDKTFFTIRPSQTEVYILCFALGLDYDVYRKLRQMLEKEFEEASEEERGQRFRASFKNKGFTTDTKRDELLQGYLEVISIRLNCAISEAQNNVDLIPSKMVEKVDANLNEHGKKNNLSIEPLIKNNSNHRRQVNH